MVDAAGEEKTRSFVRRWGLIFALLGLAFVGTVITLNQTLYSAPGFVGGYLAALERHDITSALGTPGVVPSGTGRDTLLASAGLGDLTDIRFISEADAPGGAHLIEYGFSLDGAPATATFEVGAADPRLGLFRSWRFATSPTATLAVTAVNGSDFTANGLSVDAGQVGATVPLTVLTPASVTLAHSSAYFEAPAVSVQALDPGSSPAAEVTLAASSGFVNLVQDQLDTLLDDCVTQTVLQPTGCPFGESITNRIEGTPAWSMTTYPQIAIVPGATPGTWEVPETAGAAHLVVGVRSLFDGTSSTFDADVPFAVSYLLEFPADGSVSISAR